MEKEKLRYSSCEGLRELATNRLELELFDILQNYGNSYRYKVPVKVWVSTFDYSLADLVDVKVVEAKIVSNEVKFLVLGYPNLEEILTDIEISQIKLVDLEMLVYCIDDAVPHESVKSSYDLCLLEIERMFIRKIFCSSNNSSYSYYDYTRNNSAITVPLITYGAMVTNVDIANIIVKKQRIFFVDKKGFEYKLDEFAYSTLMLLLKTK